MHKAARRLKNPASAEDQKGQEAKFQCREYDQVLRALFRMTPGSYQRDSYVSYREKRKPGPTRSLTNYQKKNQCGSDATILKFRPAVRENSSRHIE
jgi:hypothetical protein